MPGVPGVLPDHVHVDPAQRHPAQPVVRHRVIATLEELLVLF
jgi:hypothetical protein